MSSFQSSIGLATGLPIAEIVDQLMSVSAKPRDRLETQTVGLRQQQVALGELMALSIGTQLAVKRFGGAAVYSERRATSTHNDLLAASVTGSASPGSHQFVPVRMAQNHQLVSGGVSSLDQPVGEGTLSLRFGGVVDRGLDLELLNGGAGVERGTIRITDRSGATGVIDLRHAQTIDDVLDQINRNDQINVTAVVAGDAIRLIDQTGLTTANLSVREVGGGSTAADLGLAGIDAPVSEATGANLLRMFDTLSLSKLNDNTGLRIRDELPDLTVTFRDGSDPLQINLTREDVTTWGQLLDALNAADPDRLQAGLSVDGLRLVLTDLTANDGGTFAVASELGGSLAEDLGLSAPAVGDVLTGGRLLAGLKGPLLSSLSGGNGLGTLGSIQLTDRSGQVTVVDLAGAETLSEVIDRINIQTNTAGVAVTASVNPARNGIQLRDTSGSTAGNLIVANVDDDTDTADKLGLTLDAAQTTVDGGPLHLQSLHQDTPLAELNYGKGVRLGSFLITDSAGETAAINLRTAQAETVGDVIDLINGLGLGVEASINTTGDGILLVDTAGGAGTLAVRESGTGTAAADLKLLGTAATVDLQGVPTQVIDGSMTARLTIEADDTLQDVVDKINGLDMGVNASIFRSGSGANPYRLLLSSQTAGKAGEVQVDTSQFALSFHELAAAQDALLLVGNADAPGAGVLVASNSNRFSDVIEGVQLTIGGVSDSTVTIKVDQSDTSLVNHVKQFVDQYNKLRDKLKALTFFDAESETTGLLMGSGEALQVDMRLSRLVTNRFVGVGTIQSIAELGVSVDENGKLNLDELRLRDRFADDPAAVEQFLTHSEFGFVAKFGAMVESVAGAENSLLLNRNNALQRKVDANSDRIEFLDERLDAERERLLKYYYRLELAISKIQANMSVVEALAPMPLMISARGDK